MTAALGSLGVAGLLLAGVLLLGPAPRRPVGACEPYAERCRHCTDCTQCGHCASKGGKCSVCWTR